MWSQKQTLYIELFGVILAITSNTGSRIHGGAGTNQGSEGNAGEFMPSPYSERGGRAGIGPSSSKGDVAHHGDIITQYDGRIRREGTSEAQAPERVGIFQRWFCCVSKNEDDGLRDVENNSRALPPSTPFLLPHQSQIGMVGRKTLVLDLDETLVHSTFKPVPNADYVFPVDIEGRVSDVYVLKRPFVDAFMRKVCALYEVVIFTASLPKYADPLLDMLERDIGLGFKGISSRLFRHHCVAHAGAYVKDLDHLGRDLRHVVIVDNSPYSYAFQPDNAIAIGTFLDDASDRELLALADYLEDIHTCDDVTKLLPWRK